MYQKVQNDFARTMKKGLPVFPVGILFWGLMWIFHFFLPENVLTLAYLFGIGVIFPLSILVGKLIGVNMLDSSNPLNKLAGLFGALQLLFAPLVVMVYLYEPMWIPFAIGVLTGAHFLPFYGLYNSPAYLFLSIATVLVATVFGIFFIENTFAVTPLAIMVVYVITMILLIQELKVATKVKSSTSM